MSDHIVINGKQFFLQERYWFHNNRTVTIKKAPVCPTCEGAGTITITKPDQKQTTKQCRYCSGKGSRGKTEFKWEYYVAPGYLVGASLHTSDSTPRVYTSFSVMTTNQERDSGFNSRKIYHTQEEAELGLKNDEHLLY